MILYVNLDWIKNKNDFCQGGDIIDTVVFFLRIRFFVVDEFYDIPQKILCQDFHFQKEEENKEKLNPFCYARNKIAGHK